MAAPAAAATLTVGPDRALRQPSEAARIARDGDEIAIDAGTYFDCAVWTANRLTIAGAGQDTVVTDKTCEGKALFVIRGDDVRIRDLTLTRARVPDGNGAGIRAEGVGLTVTRVRFVADQEGLLAADRPDGAIRIIDSDFIGNGGRDAARALAVGRVALLRVEGSRFIDTHGASHIASAAARTELIADRIEDGAGLTATSVALPDGGDLLMTGTTLAKAAGRNRQSGVLAAADGDRAAGALVLRGNRFVNASAEIVPLLRNWTWSRPTLADNVLIGPAVEASSAGYWTHEVGMTLRRMMGSLHAIAGWARRGLLALTRE